MKEENINVLDEVNKGASMGMDAIKFILDKVKDKEFKELLEKQYDKYQEISNSINEIYSDYVSDSDKEPHETNAMTKAMTWYGINMKTMTDHTTSKLAELLVQGTNMGIIEGRRLLNNKTVPKEIEKILHKYVKMQENSLEELKKYL